MREFVMVTSTSSRRVEVVFAVYKRCVDKRFQKTVNNGS